MQQRHNTDAQAGERRERARVLLTVLCVLLGFGLAAGRAQADRDHTVGKGQTLSRIADRYGVPVGALAAANGLTRSATLREGQVLIVPPPGVVYVAPGDTLAGIARRHDVTTAELAQVNALSDGAQLRAGQRLVLPGFKGAREEAAAQQRWGRPKRRGTATLHRLSTRITRRVRLIDDRGRVRAPALRELGLLMRPRGTRKVKEPHPRLLRLLARVSDHFGGRPIHIVSGYRKPGGNTRATSRHVAAQAIDFRIPGIALAVLREYCAKLDHVGVGYYPNSNFVHLDVRRTNARWTDLSGRGEAARLERAGRVATAQPVADVVTRASQAATRATRAANEEIADEPEAADDGQPPVTDPADTPVPDPAAEP